MLFRHESCIRRGIRHEPLLIGCRIHPETWLPVRRVSRLAEPGRTCSGRVSAGRPRCRIFVRLAFAKNPEACLREMTRTGGPSLVFDQWGCPTSLFLGWGITISVMPRNLVRYRQAGDLHFITFSCYRPNPMSQQRGHGAPEFVEES
jgi:hypothetical protein